MLTDGLLPKLQSRTNQEPPPTAGIALSSFSWLNSISGLTCRIGSQNLTYVAGHERGVFPIRRFLTSASTGPSATTRPPFTDDSKKPIFANVFAQSVLSRLRCSRLPSRAAQTLPPEIERRDRERQCGSFRASRASRVAPDPGKAPETREKTYPRLVPVEVGQTAWRWTQAGANRSRCFDEWYSPSPARGRSTRPRVFLPGSCHFQ